MRLLALVVAIGCSSHDKTASVGVDTDSGHPVTLHLTLETIEVESKTGKHTFHIESHPNAELVKPVVDDIMSRGGKAGVTVWGRYDAPDVWNALAPALSEVPTTICRRDGDNC
ncbi:MAG TPA: hypothetical protein VGC41_04760 [Kofleriaceae bacterium]